jgi:hypothetical protein
MKKKRKKLSSDDVALFVRQYARRKRPGKGEPNDRSYDRMIEERIKKMKPEDLDELMRG